MYLSDFTSPLKKNQVNSRHAEGENELYCQLCNKIYDLSPFKAHI